MNKDIKNIIPQAGSDEVGTGDTFGPIVVACSLVDETNINILNELNIKDSKELTDSQILTIAPKLIKKVKYSYVILDNSKYNDMHEKYNLNEIKAILHNSVYDSLSKLTALPKLCIIDEFCPKDYYYNYLSKIENLEYKKDLTFETKAENKYISVAIASIIARYYFILEFDKLSQKYHIDLAKGSANPILENQLKEIADKYGKDELKNVAKLHFKNVKKTISDIK